MKPLNERNLLIISDRYPHPLDPVQASFVKHQVDALRKYFRNIYVLSLTPLVPKFLSNHRFLHPRWRRDAYAKDYQYDNVKVYCSKYFNLPLDFFRRRKGKATFNSAKKTIKNNYLKFDLIHAHFTYPSGYVAARLNADFKIPFILTVHENHDWLLEEINSNNNEFDFTWRSADKIIRVNKKDLENFEKLKIDKSRLIALPNGFSPSLFRPMDMIMARKELRLPIDKKILVNIATLEKQKGQKYLIESMKYVSMQRNDTMLYIVGVGTQERKLRSIIKELALAQNVILVGGGKPAKEIPLWINACDAFVLPSLSEGNPTVMFEALGCGKPFVGTRVGGIPEIIINDKLGILVEVGDSEGLAHAILGTLETEWDKDYILKYADQFTWEKIVERTIEIYNEVLSK